MSDVVQKAHARLGASNAARWMNCPGSINLSAQVPTPPTSDAAEEGTTAHAVAELLLRGDIHDSDALLGQTVEGREVTEPMIEAVTVYLDHCRDIMSRPGVRYWIERKFSLAALKPPEAMFGTADFCAYEAPVRTLHVADLKFGAGVLVEVLDSKQLRYYALGALLSLLEEDSGIVVDKIVMTIVQPRISHSDGVVRSWGITIDDLLAFAHELIAAANATQTPDAALVPGEHCRFCPATAVCPARLDHAQALAQVEFAVVEPGFAPPPAMIPIEQLAAMLPKLDMVLDYINACKQHVRSQLEAGIDVPGFKLVATRANRKFTDEKAVEVLLETMCIPSDSTHQPRELKSVAQIEKVLGKKTFNQSPISSLVVKKSGGTKLVPDSDPSPAVVITRGEEFLALPSGSEE